MNEYGNFNVSNEVMNTMVFAKEVCKDLGEYDISALDFIISCFNFKKTKLCQFLDKTNGYSCYPEDIVSDIVMDGKLYKKLTGINYSEFREYKEGLDIVFKDEEGNELEDLDMFYIDSNFQEDYSEELKNAFLQANEIEKINRKRCYTIGYTNLLHII